MFWSEDPNEMKSIENDNIITFLLNIERYYLKNWSFRLSFKPKSPHWTKRWFLCLWETQIECKYYAKLNSVIYSMGFGDLPSTEHEFLTCGIYLEHKFVYIGNLQGQ